MTHNLIFQVDTQNSQCSVMDVSSTSQALVFGDQSGHLHLFSAQHNHEPCFNNFSRYNERVMRVIFDDYLISNQSTVKPIYKVGTMLGRSNMIFLDFGREKIF